LHYLVFNKSIKKILCVHNKIVKKNNIICPTVNINNLPQLFFRQTENPVANVKFNPVK